MIPSSLLPDDTVLYSCVACLLRFMPHLPITLSYTDTKSASTRFLSHSLLWIEPHFHGVDGAQVGHILQKHIITYPHRSSHVCKAFLVDIVTYICFCKFPQSRWPQLVSNARMWLTSDANQNDYKLRRENLSLSHSQKLKMAQQHVSHT